MVPAKRAGDVAKINTESAVVGIVGIAETEIISSEISRKEDAVFCSQLIIGFGVEVIEIELRTTDVFRTKQFQKHIGISSATRNHERTFVFHNRTFQCKTGGNQPDT